MLTYKLTFISKIIKTIPPQINCYYYCSTKLKEPIYPSLDFLKC